MQSYAFYLILANCQFLRSLGLEKENEVKLTDFREIYSCNFNNKLCKWVPNNPIGFMKMKINDAVGKENTTIFQRRSRNYFIFVMNPLQGGFEMTSPKINARSRHGRLCVSFTARTSKLINASLILYNDSVLWNVVWSSNFSSDESWKVHNINVKLQSEKLKLKFRLAERVGNSKLLAFALRFVGLFAGTCEELQVANSKTAETRQSFLADNSILDPDNKRYGEARIAWSNVSYRWPGGVIPYFIAPGFFNASHESAIIEGMNDIENRTCVKFVKYTTAMTGIIITGFPFGCFASVGYLMAGGGIVNLEIPDCIDHRTIRHELMHTLGFFHEHQRPDRDDHVQIKWENVLDVSVSQFRKESADLTQTFGFPYNTDSVMHYSPYAFSKNGEPTIISKYPMAQTRAKTFTPLDVMQMRRLYSCDNLAAEAIQGGSCNQDAGDYVCLQHKPCEIGTYNCRSPQIYDDTSGLCKIGRQLTERCTGANEFCSTPNSECSSSGICECSANFYHALNNDCLSNIETQKLGQTCSDSLLCMYNLTCQNDVCACPTSQALVNDHTCVDRHFGWTCSTDEECGSIPLAVCSSGACSCPSNFEATFYVDENNVRHDACSLGVWADIGGQCNVDIGLLCNHGKICRNCPLSLSAISICTAAEELGSTWNAFPDKPPDFYIIAGQSAVKYSIALLLLTMAVAKTIKTVFCL